jgi:hypothetical protein
LGELVDPATRIEFKQIEFLDTTPSATATLISYPRLGGLHQRYAWREAA